MRPGIALVFSLWAFASSALADGGAVLFQERAAGMRITVFSSPAEPIAGPADLSVYLEEEASGEPVLDAAVTLKLTPLQILEDGESWVPPCCSMRGDDPIDGVSATRAQSDNKLLYAAEPQIEHPGIWKLEARVERAGQTVEAAGELRVRPAINPWIAYWPALALVPLGIVGFGLHQRLRHRSSRSSS